LAQTVSQGLTSLGTSIKSSVDSAIEQVTKSLETKTEDKAGDGKVDNKKDKSIAEFDLGGKHMKIEIGADGQPKFVVVDGDGKTHEYGVKLDERGNPTISVDEPKIGDGKSTTSGDKPEPANADKPDGGTSAKEENTTGTPGTVPGTPSTGKREEDGEHTPHPMPEADPQPEEPADSGARLAEAGPL
jgi:hypothetical protein